MKKRIGWLNNKPIIQGDKNLKSSNELHIDELSSSNSDGNTGDNGSNNMKISYYKISEEFSSFLELMLSCGISINNIKLKEDKGISITGYFTPLSFDYGHYWRCIGAEITEYVPIQQFGSFNGIEIEINKNTDIYGMFEQLIPIFNSAFDENPLTIDVVKQNIIPITKEEFYNLNN